MSADNYYLICRHPLGGYAAVMGFASDDELPGVDAERHTNFSTFFEAVKWANDQYSEYGVSLDPELDIPNE